MRRIDRYELLDRLGQGGGGVVWRARPIDGDAATVVALKEPRPDVAVDVDAFLREAAAMARLYHPSIVPIYDYGVYEARPWLVMEWLPGPSLRQAPPARWTSLQALLLTLLDALAHAHARDLVHRDLKPGNVLWDGAGWRLADFGLAAAGGEGRGGSGTLPYMAPEQLTGQAGLIGPWTDLYALATVAWQVATGTLPRAGGPAEVLQQAWQPLPELAPRFTVPEGLAGWLARGLDPVVDRRWRTAAHAAWALSRLLHVSGVASEGYPRSPIADGDATFSLAELLDAPHAEVEAGKATIVERGPPIPEHAPTEPPPRPAPANLGLGVVGLREHPLAGRVVETRALWQHLRGVVDEGSGRVVWVHGPSGCGRTRLLQWLGHRAAEVGAARVLWLSDDPLREVATPLLRLPADQVAISERLGRLLDVTDVDQLDRWAGSLCGDTRLAGSERVALTTALLRAAAADSPVVVLADDVGLETPAWRVLQRARERGGPLLVVCASTEAPPPDVRVVELGWLERSVIARILVGALGLAADVADAIAEEAGGSPRYAVGRVRALSQSGALVPGPSGLTVDADGIGQPLDRLAPWLEPLSEEERHVAELGAVLGARPSPPIWRRAAAAAGLTITPAVLRHGERSGLVVPDGDGWRLVDAEVRQLLVRRAAIAGRLRGWHRRCAEALDRALHPDRVARHLVAAGDLADAVQPLWTAARDSAFVGAGPRQALDRFRQLEALLDQVGSEEELWHARGWLAWSLRHVGRLDEGEALARRVVEAGRAMGDPELVASGLHTLASSARGQGRPSVTLWRRTLEAYEASGNETYAATVRTALLYEEGSDELFPYLEARLAEVRSPDRCLMLGQHLLRDRRYERGRALLLEARAALERKPGTEAIVRTIHHLCAVSRAWSGHPETARSMLRELLQNEIDDQRTTARLSWVALVDVHLLLDDPDGARRVLSSGRSEVRLDEPHGTHLRMTRAALDAWLGDEGAFDARLVGGTPARQPGRHGRYVLCWLADRAAAWWREHGDEDRARAVEQWVAAQRD